jgi:hypothetical protein
MAAAHVIPSNRQIVNARLSSINLLLSQPCDGFLFAEYFFHIQTQRSLCLGLAEIVDRLAADAALIIIGFS